MDPCHRAPAPPGEETRVAPTLCERRVTLRWSEPGGNGDGMKTLGARIGVLVAPLSDVSIRRLWFARVISEGGDWAARLALGLLVFGETHSALATTAVTAVSLLPHLGIGQVLGTLADRFPHRTVMVVSELWRGTV